MLNLVSAKDTPLEVVTVTETEIPLTERLNPENIASLEQARVDLLAQGLPPPVVGAMVLQIANDCLAMDAFFRSVPAETMAQADWNRLAEEQAARGNLFLWAEDENGDLLRSQLVRWPIRPQMDPETGQVTLVPASESEAHEQFALQIEAFNAGSSPVAPISRAVPQP